VLDEQFNVGRLVDRARDALPALRTENQRAEDQQVERGAAARVGLSFLG
jgi:hypothetical protein